ncbi:MAG: N-acetyltransferase, partial [Treponema sp.]|nr:N-acetyltransferase [Treponema sp.]
MDFIIEDNRIYASAEDGNVVAEITFPTKDGIATIDHTFVADSLRGQGIAGKLMEAAVAKIQADGNKIAATCS